MNNRTQQRFDQSIRDAVAETALTVKFQGKTYPVASVEEASAKWCEFRDSIVRNGDGGVSSLGNGLTVRSGKKIVAKISYNGRIWPA